MEGKYHYEMIIVQLEDPNMPHYKIYNRVSHLLICLSVGIW